MPEFIVFLVIQLSTIYQVDLVATRIFYYSKTSMFKVGEVLIHGKYIFI